MRALVFGSALMLGISSASAQQTGPEYLASTADLVQQCRDRSEFCYGYIMGSGQLYQILVAAETIQPVACIEPRPTLEQLRGDLITWADANPDELDQRPIDGLWLAIASKYPCPR